MAKYLVLWELDESKIPDDPKERKAAWLAAQEAVAAQMKSGLVKDRGNFLGVTAGFTIEVGDPEEVLAGHLQWIPFCRMKVYPFVSLDEAQASLKKSG